ncbi:short-chain dehydrogenase/reductase SDR [Cyanobacterium stanieri PCC 7202]|uniref:Short-chain dehydrogenase/reductase SDR n=1 Tax=Cyanobacterium stanieri (strain ATCC 29140 / PCC 7202) TaxID=292563 RepID=K9YLT7_CYASC|nr:short-chain dehydrogenase/reductase SDR [Cyanobacterium stanieri PCC 7202]
MENSPNQKRAIITGASSGIGKAVAIKFAQAGIDLCLIARSAQKLDEVAKIAADYGVQVKTHPFDLENTSQVQGAIAHIVEQWGGIDILVNNAGIAYTNLLRETPLEDWQKVLNLNLTSVFQCIMGVLPTMREQQQGTIINVASIAASSPFPEWGTYAVSKAALVTLSQSLAMEERSNGIRVTTISPGAVNTPIWDTDTVNADLNRSAMLTPEIVAETILHAALLPQSSVIENLTVTPSLGAL